MAPRSLTPRQRRRIQQEIRDGHLAFLAETFGPASIDQEDYERLRAAGKVRDEKTAPQDAVSAAHAVGVASAAEQPGSAGTGHPASGELWRQLRDDPQVITEAEREAVAIARDRIGQYVRGLGNELEVAVGHLLVDLDNEARRGRLSGRHGAPRGGASAEVVLARVRTAVNNLRRDWLRVAHTELHNVSEEAKAVVMADGHSDGDPRVFKRVHEDACAYCKLLYLRPGGAVPRVFRLSTLLGNGTNVGRRAGKPSRRGRSRTEWRAVVGAVHPFCRCSMHVLPDGMGFDARGGLVYVGVAKSMSIELELPDEELVNHRCEE